MLAVCIVFQDIVVLAQSLLQSRVQKDHSPHRGHPLALLVPQGHILFRPLQVALLVLLVDFVCIPLHLNWDRVPALRDLSLPQVVERLPLALPVPLESIVFSDAQAPLAMGPALQGLTQS